MEKGPGFSRSENRKELRVLPEGEERIAQDEILGSQHTKETSPVGAIEIPRHFYFAIEKSSAHSHPIPLTPSFHSENSPRAFCMLITPYSAHLSPSQKFISTQRQLG
jgi:hypothetical protein